MKTATIKVLAPALLLAALSPELSIAFAQGSLTPPGAPAPTMKTLAQIEPRTPISSAPFTISVAGSYYLTTNLTVASGNAITIATSGVTLDLNGFTIGSSAPSATGAGVMINTRLSDLIVCNGHIQGGVTNGLGTYAGPGFQYGIYSLASGIDPVNTRVSAVSVAGCLTYGIYLGYGDSTVVDSCAVRTVGSYGIVAATIKSSVAVDCGVTAINGQAVSDSRGESGGSGYGVHATSAVNCYGSSVSGYGLYANIAQSCYGSANGNSSSTGLSATTAVNCYGSSYSSYGLYATTAQNCYGISTAGSGLYGSTAQNCYAESNGSSGTGLSATTALNCYGYNSTSGGGLYAGDLAIGCHGYSYSGTGLTAYIANSCRGSTSFGTPQTVTYKYNMP